MQPPILAVGIPWYRKADYRKILKIMTDSHLLPATYEQWEHKAQSVEADMRAQGYVVVRAIIDPKTFRAWCRERSLNVDARGRSEFAHHEAYHQARH